MGESFGLGEKEGPDNTENTPIGTGHAGFSVPAKRLQLTHHTSHQVPYSAVQGEHER